jgi:N-acetylmuramoyl-L-alanine amidase
LGVSGVFSTITRPQWLFGALFAVVALVLGIGFGAPGAFAQSQPEGRVTGLSATVENGETVISVRMTRAVRYRVFALPQPSPRLVADLDRVTWALSGRAQAGTVRGAGLVRQIRFAQKSSTESRLVMDLSTPARIVSQELAVGFGGRVLRLRLAPVNGEAFARAAPLPAPKAIKSVDQPTGPIRPDARRRFVIVIDPGHGGKDPGATGFSKKNYEKTIVLASGLALRDILRRDPRFQVVMTRETDVFLPLQRRIVIAREARADLFISLHADAAPPNVRVRGATVYTLSEEGGQRARQLLNSENWTIAPGNQSRDNAVTSILKDLTQRDTKNQSAVFAQTLLELGFMTTEEDETRLMDPAYRRGQMQATAQAIVAYFSRPEVSQATSRPKAK